MAKLFQGTAVDYAQFTAILPKADILIASSGAPHYILRKDEMQRVIAARRNKPMFLIDIAVPRNIDPAVNEIDNVFLYDIDDLQEVVNANLRERKKEAHRAEALVEEEVDRAMARLKAAEVTPTIVGLQEQLEQIRAGEMDKVRRRYGPFRRGKKRPSKRSRTASSIRSRTGPSPSCATTPAIPMARTSSRRSAKRSTFRIDMLVIASRGSQLASWQSSWAARRLAQLGHACAIHMYKTTGDKITDVPLAKVGSKGLFTKEIEEALLDGRADIAVHSLKDLPTELPDGLVLAAVPEREDARDALVGSTLAALPPGARVGTSSLRRAAQLRKLRPDLTLESVRGNLDTRLRKLDEGQYAAILLAAAGLKRLGWGDRIAELLPVEVMCPAVGQGALAIETRSSGAGLEACRGLDHAATHAAVAAERGLLQALGGGCQVPIGAYATVEGERLRMVAVVASPDGAELVRGESQGPAADAARIGRELGEDLLGRGARRILEAVYT